MGATCKCCTSADVGSANPPRQTNVPTYGNNYNDGFSIEEEYETISDIDKHTGYERKHDKSFEESQNNDPFKLNKKSAKQTMNRSQISDSASDTHNMIDHDSTNQ
eukprot:902638_1